MLLNQGRVLFNTNRLLYEWPVFKCSLVAALKCSVTIMQADSLFMDSIQYTVPMTARRPAKFTRSAFGEKLFAIRQQMGLSQLQLAEELGITKSTYAGWERRTTALKPDYIAKIASVVNVSVDYRLGRENGGQRKGGPVGKARRFFEEVSKLPRHQQQRIPGIVKDLIAAQRAQR